MKQKALPGYMKVLFLLLCLWNLSPVLAHEVSEQPHPCALTRQKLSTQLRRDGITSESHKALMRQYDVHSYKLDLHLERNTIEVNGNVTIHASSLKDNLSQFAFELHSQLKIDSVLVNGRKSTFQRFGGEVIVNMPVDLDIRQTFAVQIFYKGTAPSGAEAAIGNGLNTGVVMQPWRNQITWSLSEPFAAFEWFPCKQLLEDKADSLEVWVTTDVANKVGSNGLLQRVVSLPNNKHRYEWKSRYPIAYYLISVAVGQYQDYSFSVNLPGLTQPLLVQNFIYEGTGVLDTYKTGIDQTGPLLQTFSDLFGLYPFYKEKYGHSMAPMGGGMEHQTMTTQSSFEFTLTAHELAHQWWGDEVTCADWSHIWLNEGFASYAEYLALASLKTPAEAKDWLFRADLSARVPSSGSVFVRDSLNVARIFNSSLSYKKGAYVLHMLRRTLGSDSLFFQSLRAYRSEYKYKVANTRDLQKVVERKSGRSFQQFFDQWVYGEGYPTYEIRWAQTGNTLYIKSIQTPSSTATPLFISDVEFLIKTTEGDTLVKGTQDENTKQFIFKVNGTVQGIQVDPDQWLLEFVSGVVNDQAVIPPFQSISEIKIYPNPTTQYLQLEGGPGLPEEAEILDMLGRKIRKLIIQGHRFSVEGLKPGTYILRLRYEQGVTVRHFVKL